MSNKPKLKKNGGKGTGVGNALRWLVSSGKEIAPEILALAADITGIEVLDRLAVKISGDTNMSAADKELLLAQLALDTAREQEVTKRWIADMNSESWLAKNVRPLVVMNFTALIDVVIICSIAGKDLGEAYIPILMTMGITAIGGYFTLREFGKTRR